jgi:hypothetical protein
VGVERNLSSLLEHVEGLGLATGASEKLRPGSVGGSEVPARTVAGKQLERLPEGCVCRIDFAREAVSLGESPRGVAPLTRVARS